MKRMATITSLVALAMTSAMITAGPARAADAAGATVLSIDDTHACKAGRPVMQGMAADGGSNLYIIFTEADGVNPILTRWVRSGSTWTCNPADSRAGLSLGHGNDMTYHSNYGLGGKALLITMGTSSNDDKTIAVIGLNSDGTIGSAKSSLELDHVVTGFCYSSTANKFVARDQGTMWVYDQVSGKPDLATDKAYSITKPSSAGTTDQGLDCSANYVWSARSIYKGNDGSRINWVYQYNWTGGLVSKIQAVTSPADLGGSSPAKEIEDIFHLSSDFYIGINRNGAAYPDLIADFTE